MEENGYLVTGFACEPRYVTPETSAKKIENAYTDIIFDEPLSSSVNDVTTSNELPQDENGYSMIQINCAPSQPRGVYEGIESLPATPSSTNIKENNCTDRSSSFNKRLKNAESWKKKFVILLIILLCIVVAMTVVFSFTLRTVKNNYLPVNISTSTTTAHNTTATTILHDICGFRSPSHGACFKYSKCKRCSFDMANYACQRIGYVPGNLYNQKLYDRAVEYLIKKIDIGEDTSAKVWLGMTYNATTNELLLSDGSRSRYAEWGVSYSRRKNHSAVTLSIGGTKGIKNRPPSYIFNIHGVLCERGI